MDRTRILIKKCEELRESLTIWAISEQILEPGESLIVNLDVVSNPMQSEIDVPEHQDELSRLNQLKGARKVVSGEITDSEWNMLMKRTKGLRYHYILEILNRKKNQAVDLEEIDRTMEGRAPHRAAYEYGILNCYFIQARLNYAVRKVSPRTAKGGSSNKGLIKLFRVLP